MKVVSHLSLLQPNCRVHNRLPMVPILSQSNPVHILPTPVVKIPFKATFTRVTKCTSSKQVRTGNPYSFLSFLYFTISLPFHSPQTQHPSNMGALHVTKLLIMPYPPRPVTSSLSGTHILFITLRSHSLNVIPLLWNTKLYNHTKQHAKLHKQRVTSTNISSYSSQALQSLRTLASRTIILRSFRSLATAH